ncbi:MAG: hypothetical protein IJ716_14600 [Lachnospiraceae bacterium]|nr:hypothetical protein [Lachnospiraceae bacterium]
MLDRAISVAAVLYGIGIILMVTNLVPDVLVAIAAFVISVFLGVISLVEEG